MRTSNEQKGDFLRIAKRITRGKLRNPAVAKMVNRAGRGEGGGVGCWRKKKESPRAVLTTPRGGQSCGNNDPNGRGGSKTHALTQRERGKQKPSFGAGLGHDRILARGGVAVV